MTPRAFLAFGLTIACAIAIPAADVTASSGSKGAAAAKAKSDKPGASGAIGSRSTAILGAAWNADNSPIPNARLRLRNLATGKVEATAVANEAGQFSFTGIEDGAFVIELVSEKGKVLKLGERLIIAAGVTVATFVRLEARVSFVSTIFSQEAREKKSAEKENKTVPDGTEQPAPDPVKFFTETAAASTSAAASIGIPAIEPDVVRPGSARK